MKDKLSPINNLDSDYFKLQKGEQAGKLLIVFSSMKIPAGRFTFVRSLLEFPYDILFVNDACNGWYQNGVPGLGNSVDETCDAIKRIAQDIKANELFTMGSSMGAYGALLFAAKLQVPCLALDPETALDTPASRSAKNMPETTKRNYPDLLPILNEYKSNATIFSGEMDIVDLFNAERVSSLKSLTIITMKDQAHSSASYLNDRYNICKIAIDYVNGKDLPTPPNKGSICDHPGLVEVLCKTDSDMNSKNAHVAASILSEMTSKLSLPPVFWYRYGVAQLLSGDVHGAVISQSKATSLAPEFGKAHLQLGIGLRRINNLSEAIDSFNRAEKVSPAMFAIHYQKGLTFRAMSLRDKAESSFRAAWEIEPKNKAVCDALAKELEFSIELRESILRKIRSNN